MKVTTQEGLTFDAVPIEDLPKDIQEDHRFMMEGARRNLAKKGIEITDMTTKTSKKPAKKTTKKAVKQPLTCTKYLALMRKHAKTGDLPDQYPQLKFSDKEQMKVVEEYIRLRELKTSQNLGRTFRNFEMTNQTAVDYLYTSQFKNPQLYFGFERWFGSVQPSESVMLQTFQYLLDKKEVLDWFSCLKHCVSPFPVSLQNMAVKEIAAWNKAAKKRGSTNKWQYSEEYLADFLTDEEAIRAYAKAFPKLAYKGIKTIRDEEFVLYAWKHCSGEIMRATMHYVSEQEPSLAIQAEVLKRFPDEIKYFKKIHPEIADEICKNNPRKAFEIDGMPTECLVKSIATLLLNRRELPNDLVEKLKKSGPDGMEAKIEAMFVWFFREVLADKSKPGFPAYQYDHYPFPYAMPFFPGRRPW